MLTDQFRKLAPESAAISFSTMAHALTRALAAGHPTSYTSPSRFSQRPNQGQAIHLASP